MKVRSINIYIFYSWRILNKRNWNIYQAKTLVKYVLQDKQVYRQALMNFTRAENPKHEGRDFCF
jgi:hypothetical protein